MTNAIRPITTPTGLAIIDGSGSDVTFIVSINCCDVALSSKPVDPLLLSSQKHDCAQNLLPGKQHLQITR